MRSRVLRPGYFKNEVLCEQDPLVRILFAGLWCLADREGRLEDRPKRIKLDVLGYDNVDVDEMLDTLAGIGFVIRYEADDTRLIQIVNFGKHQSPHQKEAPSIFPAPVGYVPAPDDSVLDREIPVLDREIPGNSGASTNIAALVTSASSSASSIPVDGPRRKRRDPSDKQPFTDEMRSRLYAKWLPKFGSTDAIDLKIEMAFDYELWRTKYTSPYPYLDDWLDRQYVSGWKRADATPPRPKKDLTGMEHI
jgi:hypothetical protein